MIFIGLVGAHCKAHFLRADKQFSRASFMCKSNQSQAVSLVLPIFVFIAVCLCLFSSPLLDVVSVFHILFERLVVD